jgi:hypothetical protein
MCAGVATAAALLVLTLPGSPAQAVGSTSMSDPSGVDYDAACGVDVSLSAPPPNSYASPFGSGCFGVSLYDGSTEATDLNGTSAVTLASDTLGHVIGSCTIDGRLPAAGMPSLPPPQPLDTPSAQFLGAGCKVMFQNRSVETNVPTNPSGGCARLGVGNPVLDEHGSWKDGYHFFVGFEVNWDGLKWIYSAQIGEYDPSPTGGFIFNELGTKDGNGWHSANPYHPYGTGLDQWNVSITGTGPTTITVTAPGIYRLGDTLDCQEGFFKTVYAKPGDSIASVKGVTTANDVVTLPVTVPLSLTCDLIGDILCLDDLTTVGGLLFFSDVTDGDSTAGLFNSNIRGVAYTTGVAKRAISNEWINVLGYLQHLLDTTPVYGINEVPDTLGPGLTCPTPTFGGLLPTNPLFTPDTACQIDDDSIARGSFLPEFWDTVHGFTF